MKTGTKINPKYIGTAEAGKLTGLSRPTIVSWMKANKAGVKIGGIWYVDKEKFLKLLGPLIRMEGK